MTGSSMIICEIGQTKSGSSSGPPSSTISFAAAAPSATA